MIILYMLTQQYLTLHEYITLSIVTHVVKNFIFDSHLFIY